MIILSGSLWRGLRPSGRGFLLLSEGHTWVGSELRDYTAEVWPKGFTVGSRRPDQAGSSSHGAAAGREPSRQIGPSKTRR